MWKTNARTYWPIKHIVSKKKLIFEVCIKKITWLVDDGQDILFLVADCLLLSVVLRLLVGGGWLPVVASGFYRLLMVVIGWYRLLLVVTGSYRLPPHFLFLVGCLLLSVGGC